MSKIKMNNFTFTYDGKNINNLDLFKKMLAESQSNVNLNNSKDDDLSAKRKTNVKSNSVSVTYFQ